MGRHYSVAIMISKCSYFQGLLAVENIADILAGCLSGNWVLAPSPRKQRHRWRTPVYEYKTSDEAVWLAEHRLEVLEPGSDSAA